MTLQVPKFICLHDLVICQSLCMGIRDSVLPDLLPLFHFLFYSSLVLFTPQQVVPSALSLEPTQSSSSILFSFSCTKGSVERQLQILHPLVSQISQIPQNERPIKYTFFAHSESLLQHSSSKLLWKILNIFFSALTILLLLILPTIIAQR